MTIQSIADAFPILADAIPDFRPSEEDWEDQLSYIFINDMVRYVCDRAYPEFEPMLMQFAALLERLYIEDDSSVHDLAHEALDSLWARNEQEQEIVAGYFGPKTREVWLRICAGEHGQ
ncbi:MAG: hypothetical protein WBX19_15610 [Terracidiphilus sp.]